MATAEWWKGGGKVNSRHAWQRWLQPTFAGPGGTTLNRAQTESQNVDLVSIFFYFCPPRTVYTSYRVKHARGQVSGGEGRKEGDGSTSTHLKREPLGDSNHCTLLVSLHIAKGSCTIIWLVPTLH